MWGIELLLLQQFWTLLLMKSNYSIDPELEFKFFVEMLISSVLCKALNIDKGGVSIQIVDDSMLAQIISKSTLEPHVVLFPLLMSAWRPWCLAR